MLPYPNINPDIIHIGSVHVRWYGVMYILGIAASYALIQKQKRARRAGLTGQTAQDLIFYLAVGLIVGARIGYLIFYQYNDYAYYFQHPIEIIATWRGGMSFHGGLIGCVLAGWWFCRRRGIPFWAAADAVVVTAPIGLGLGRLGNFINGELYGRVTDSPLGMIFPEGGPLPRHPSQLYEAALEGLVLFILLWLLRQRPFRDGMMTPFFLFFYGLFRFIVEFFREPDVQLGFVLGPFTMGQLLCFAMMLAGVGLGLILRMKQDAFQEECEKAALGQEALKSKK